MSFYMSQGLLLYWRQTCGRNPAKLSTPQTHLRVALAAAPRPSHGEDWLGLYDLAEEKGKHVRLDWKVEEPPSNMHDARAAAAPLALKLKWTSLFSYRFFAGKSINLLELESLISLLKRSAREETRAQRLLVLVDSRVVLEAVSKGRSRSRKINFLLRKLGFWCLAYDIALELVCVPTWANQADALSTEQTDRKLVCLFAKASFYADRSVGISSRSLGAGSAP